MKGALVVLLTLGALAAGISIKMDNKRNFYCYKVDVPDNSILDGSYLVSGESEDQTNVRVYNSRYEVAEEILKKEAGVFSVHSQSKGGNYSVCAENLGKGTKTFTLHFEIMPEAVDAAKGTQIELLNDRVRTLYFTLNSISTNIEKLRTRETVHYESNVAPMIPLILVIKSSNKSVVLWNVLKIVAFIVVSCIEVYMITDFFNKQEKRREAFRSAQTKF